MMIVKFSTKISVLNGIIVIPSNNLVATRTFMPVIHLMILAVGLNALMR